MARSRALLLLALGGAAIAIACGSSSSSPANVATDAGPSLPIVPPADPCTDSAISDVKSFPLCGLGAGSFGRWIVDGFGLPAYEYWAAQEIDDRAKYPNSLSDDRRLHWHQLGNDRVTAMATNDGWISLFGQERGATFYNRFAADQQNYAGGFGFVSASAGDAWATAYAYRPSDAKVRRVFGIGYVEYQTEHDGIRVTRRTFAPPGDVSALVSDVVIESVASRDLRYYEYWDVNWHQLVFELLRGGVFGTSGDATRDMNDGTFAQSVTRDADGTLRASMKNISHMIVPGPADVSPRDFYPNDVFLAELVGTVADAYSDQSAFFGAGGAAHPDAVATTRGGELVSGVSALGQPAMLVARSDVHVDPSAPIHLRYAYGYAPSGAALPIDPSWRDVATDVLGATLASWKEKLAYFASATDPALHREVAWRSYYVQSASGYLDYFQTHTVPQGSAYLFLHGFDGAPRDQSLFAMPLTYVAPDRARDLLTLVMELTRGDSGAIAYSYHGNGVLESAGIHDKSSDLDIYFLMALAEYVAATGDRAFLDAHVSFYPRGATALPPGASSDTVLDHARAALRHLTDVVGVGDHGLVKVGSGDWNDGIALYLGVGDAQTNTIASGESHANAAMAAFVLPLAADVLEANDATLAASLRAFGASQLTAIRAAWTGRWYPRAWLRDAKNAPTLIGGDANFLWLETQPWALLAGAPDDTQRAALIDAIDRRVDSPSPIGAMIQEPAPMNEESAQVWPAITGPLTWAYTRTRPDLAWRSVTRNTNYAHAVAYPDIWYGIWTAPDGVNGARSKTPGIAWSSVATPMTDFPAMNANPDAMGLLGVIRIAGVEPVADGLRVNPSLIGGAYVLDTKLIRLDVTPISVAGEYRAQNDGAIVVHIPVPPGHAITGATVRGAPAATALGANGDTLLTLTFARGDRVSFELDFEPMR